MVARQRVDTRGCEWHPIGSGRSRPLLCCLAAPTTTEVSRPMANSPSQIKRNRQNETRRQRNKTVRTALKTSTRSFRQAVEAGDQAQAEEAYRVVARKLDKAADKGVVHANYAANKKSKMAKALQRL